MTFASGLLLDARSVKLIESPHDVSTLSSDVEDERGKNQAALLVQVKRNRRKLDTTIDFAGSRDNLKDNLNQFTGHIMIH